MREIGDLRRQRCKCLCGKVYGSPGALSKHIFSKASMRKPEDHKMVEVLWTSEQEKIFAEYEKK